MSSSHNDVPIPPSDPPPPPPASLFPDDDLEDDIVSSDDYDYDNDNDLDDEPEPIPDIVVTPPATLPVTTPPPPPPPPHHPPPFSSAVASAATPPDRRLFQRLWTDEDEIELLQGFHDYTVSRGGVHHHDTAAFYDQIKTKLQLDFNKNQLVEKLRRLKKKYRNVLNKINSPNGRDFVFKSPHDHATFQISQKIWSNLTPNSNSNSRGGGVGVGVGVVEFETSNDVNMTTSANNNPVKPMNNTSYVVSHINLNTGSPGGGGGAGFDGSSDSGLSKMLSRKRPRVAAPPTPKVEDKIIKIEAGFVNNNNTTNASIINNLINNSNQLSNVSVSSQLQEMVEETVRNCLSPVLKNLINSATIGAGVGVGVVSPDGGQIPGFKGVGALALNAAPLNFTGLKVQGGMDDKWRKQQIMELEVYSKRLELVQDQIKSSLDELRSMES